MFYKFGLDCTLVHLAALTNYEGGSDMKIAKQFSYHSHAQKNVAYI